MAPMPSTAPSSAHGGFAPALFSTDRFEAVEQTFPQMLRARAQAEPDEVAFSHWDGTRAAPTTWGEYAEGVREVALGLHALGVVPGDRVAIMSPARVEWVVTALGILSAGGIPVGLYPTSSVAETKQALAHSEAKAVFAESTGDIAKVAEVAGELPALRAVIGFDIAPSGFPAVVASRTWTALRADGRGMAATDPQRFDELVDMGEIDQPAALFYTSGSTGAPKGVVHTHRTLQYSVLSFATHYPEVATVRHDLVGFLGLSHVAPALVGVYVPIMTRLVITFCRMEQRVEALVGVRPTAVVWPPRLHEKLLSEALAELKASPAVFRAAYGLAMKVGRQVAARRWQVRETPWHLRLPYKIALRCVFVPLRRKVGMDRITVAWTASGAMTPEVHALWQVWGLDLRELYGTTETCGAVLAQWDRSFPPPGTIGKSVPDSRWAIRTTDDGELLVKAPLLFRGYWNDPEATSEVMEEGWYHTGDLVEIDSTGEVKLIGRAKDVVITTGGKTISPQPIEVRLKVSPLIEEAVVVGDGRKYLTALIWPSAEGAALDDAALAQGLRSCIAGMNADLARPLQIKEFRIPPRALSLEKGELTLKGTIRRAAILASFNDVVEEMYDAVEQNEFARQVRLPSSPPN